MAETMCADVQDRENARVQQESDANPKGLEVTVKYPQVSQISDRSEQDSEMRGGFGNNPLKGTDELRDGRASGSSVTKGDDACVEVVETEKLGDLSKHNAQDMEQAPRYIQIMEQRLAQMERRIADINRQETPDEKPTPGSDDVKKTSEAKLTAPKVEDVTPAPGDKPSPSEAPVSDAHSQHSAPDSVPSSLILGIKRVTHKEDSLYGAMKEGSGENHKAKADISSWHKPFEGTNDLASYHVIDVIVDEPVRIEPEIKEQTMKTPADSSQQSKLTNHPSSVQSIGNLSKSQPLRIRINSKLLLYALERITKLDITFKFDSDDGDLLPMIMLRPFKILVTWEQTIRQEIARLREIHTSVETQDNARKDSDKGTKDDNASKTEMDDNVSSTGTDDSMWDFDSKRCLEELSLLEECLDTDLKSTFEIRKQIETGKMRHIAFQDLWHLYRIGTDIVFNVPNGSSQVYRIIDIADGKPFLCKRDEVDNYVLNPAPFNSDVPTFYIQCHYYEWNGQELGFKIMLFTVQSYDEPKPITSLQVYPMDFYKQIHESRPVDYFAKRGKRFIELTCGRSVVHKRYHGLTLAIDGIRDEIDSEVIIDVGTAIIKNNLIITFDPARGLLDDIRSYIEFTDPTCRREGCCQNTPIIRDYIVDFAAASKMKENKKSVLESLDINTISAEQDSILCPCEVYGYALRNRKWVKLQVDLIKDVEMHQRGFESLVLPDGHRDTLLALVQTHFKNEKLAAEQAQHREMDLVRGKGKGLIILLHGEPGVGKSSTAECVAEFRGRPLLPVTCGDIGATAEEVEKRLETHFQLAHRWGCVMLLDEADVFLEARSKVDLQRNAIVSVFLRALEYYSGILFLTTNRVGAFDPAFRSRIHMSLFYPKIDEAKTIEIWTNNLSRAAEVWDKKLQIREEDRKKILGFAATHYRELAKSESTWNGRQIRNAFQTAIALAEWKACNLQDDYPDAGPFVPILTTEHFERVAKASSQFDDYLKKTQKHTLAKQAEMKNERCDYYGDEEAMKKHEWTPSKSPFGLSPDLPTRAQR